MVQVQLTRFALVAGLVWASGQALAAAESGRPIIYRGASTESAAKPAAAGSEAIVPRVQDRASKRILFRYPGTAPAADQPAPLTPVKLAGARQPLDIAAGSPTAAAPSGHVASFDLAQAPVRIGTAVGSAPAAPRRYAGLGATPSPSAGSTGQETGGFGTAARRFGPATVETTPTPTGPLLAGAPIQLSSVAARPGASLEQQEGLIGIYPDGFDGQPTANGEIFRSGDLTAAHPSLPLPSLVQIVNDQTGDEIVVRVNDRGPFYGARAMEVSQAAADALGYKTANLLHLRYRYLGPAPVAPATSPVRPVPVVEASSMPEPVREDRPVTAPTAGAPRDTHQFFVQAGSFSNIRNAQRLSQGLDRGLPVEITQVRVNNSDFFRVMVGPFDSRSQAQIHRDQLDSAGIANGYILTR
jgi:rare lipoprotein A